MLRAADIVLKSDTGRQRPHNEDSALARAPVFVVADGMGGAQAGEVASMIAVDAFKQGLPEDGNAEERLATRAREANRRIHELSHANRERAGMGTTLTAAFVDREDLAIAHVGDSRAYLFRAGELKPLTQDHSLVEELKRQGKLTEEQAAEHPQRSIITRALGPEAQVEVDTWSYPLRAGDVVLLCSDGLTSMISEQTVREILRTSDGLERGAQALIDEANAAGGRDNITVVLFRLEEVGAEPGVDQPTVVVAPSAAVTERPTAEQSPAPVAAPPGATPPVRVPLARTQGRPAAASKPRRSKRRWRKPFVAGLATVIVLFLIGAGGYLVSRQFFFIGTNAEGIVTIYRGLPYDLPVGIHLYGTFYVSGVPASLVPADRRNTLLNHDLRSQSDAKVLVRDLELGKVSS